MHTGVAQKPLLSEPTSLSSHSFFSLYVSEKEAFVILPSNVLLGGKNEAATVRDRLI